MPSSRLVNLGKLTVRFGKTFSWIVALWGVAVAMNTGELCAQDDMLVVNGTLRHEDSNAKLVDITVSVLQNGESFDQILTDRNGQYFLELPLNQNYTIEFVGDGMVTKRVQINAGNEANPLESDGYTFDLDMTLFDMVEGFDLTIMDSPIGIANVDDRGKLQFDMAHTQDMRRAIDRELDRLANMEEDLARARMRYDNAMEDGERAEVRERWEDAKTEYQIALNFIPGDDRAQAGLDRANAALNDLQREEREALAAEEAAAEQQRAEERAAEEARAAALQAEEEAARDAAKEAEAAARAEEAAARAEEAARRSAQSQAGQEDQGTDDGERSLAEEKSRDAERRAAEKQAAADAQAQERAQGDAAREARRLAEEERAKQSEEAASEQAARLDANRAALEAKELELQERLKAQEEARAQRKAESQSRSNEAGLRNAAAEDEAELYYRQAVESERRAAAAAVEDQKEEVQMATDRWQAESAMRAERARLDATSQDRGHGSTGRDVQDGYAGRSEEHREHIIQTQGSLEDDKARWAEEEISQAELTRNRGALAKMELNLIEEASKHPQGEVILAAEDRDIPRGVQETSYDIQNGIVIQRTVREGDVVTRYRKVVTKTGVYYFQGDQSITKAIWDLKTNPSYD